MECCDDDNDDEEEHYPDVPNQGNITNITQNIWLLIKHTEFRQYIKITLGNKWI